MGRLRTDFLDRTVFFSASVLRGIKLLPRSQEARELLPQIVRSGTSIGANVHEADQALSSADFAYRCGIARREASEAKYWFRVCGESQLLPPSTAAELVQEADQFMRILNALIRRTKLRTRKKPS